MAIDKIKVGSTNHDLEARTVIARDLDNHNIEKKIQIAFCTKDYYNRMTSIDENVIYFIQ